MSQVTLVGNLTQDPTLKTIKTGNSLVSVGLAVSRRWRNKQDQWEEETSFFDVTAWGELAENMAASLSKGNKVIVSGRLEQQTWEKDGQKHSKVVVIADDCGPSLRKAQISGLTKTGVPASKPLASVGRASLDDEAPF